VRFGLTAFWSVALAVGTAQVSVPQDPAKELFEGVCSGCHSLDRVKVQHRTRKEWQETTRAMIDQGAVLTPEETNMLLDYLAKNFGPEDEGKAQ
jgi:mono/diheme cytochrome c family protein